MTSLDALTADMRTAIKAAQDCPVEQFEAYRSDFRSICTIGNVSRILDALAAALARAEAAERERDQARKIIADTLWMARRYADGRMSYAAGMYNDAARIALSLGFVKDGDREPVFAHDGMGADYANLSLPEHERAKAYSDALIEAERQVAALKEGLRPFVEEEATWSLSVSDSYRPGILEPNQKTAHAKAAFCIGDLRRAAALLSPDHKGES